MSRRNDYDDDDDFDYEDSGPRGGDTISEIRRAQRAAEKRAKQLEAELQVYRAEARKRNVEAVVKARGLNPLIVDLLPESATDEEQVNAFLEKYAPLFAPQGEAGGGSAEGSPSDSYEPPAQARSFEKAVNAGQAPQGDESQILALIQGASTPAELNKILFGNANGPTL